MDFELFFYMYHFLIHLFCMFMLGRRVVPSGRFISQRTARESH